jgi:tRNA threonylcarbamoyladenosine biosynthesis protein TsaE
LSERGLFPVTKQFSTFKYQITTRSVDETQKLGKSIGTALTDGTVLALTGDLGSGKTAFVQGLARGLEVPDNYYITSPSYTLINEYPGRFPLLHVDLYRISDPMDMENIGIYEILYDNGVVAIEWADRIDQKFLTDSINIHFEITNTETRKICIDVNNLKDMYSLKKIEASINAYYHGDPE